MKRSELKQIIKEEIVKVLRENATKLSPKEQNTVDDILNKALELDELNVKDSLKTFKNYLVTSKNKGLLTAGVLLALLASPKVSQAQKDVIKDFQKTEMSTKQSISPMMDISGALKSISPDAKYSKENGVEKISFKKGSTVINISFDPEESDDIQLTVMDPNKETLKNMTDHLNKSNLGGVKGGSSSSVKYSNSNSQNIIKALKSLSERFFM